VHEHRILVYAFIGDCSECGRGSSMQNLLSSIGLDEGQDIAEYAVMLAVILVLVIGTIRLVGSNANNAFSAVASSIQ
jgi:Flp pilus assembly pilin Flp